MALNGDVALAVQISSMQGKADISKLEDMDLEVAETLKNLKQAEADAQLFNSREVLFGLPQEDYSGIRKIMDQFEPFYQFWHTSAEFAKKHKSWMEDSWEKLVPDEVESDVTNAFKTFHKTGRIFQQRGLGDQASLAEQQKAFAEDFKKFVPLIHALRMPGMKDRHWDMISENLGYDFKPQKDFTMSKAESMGLLDHIEMLSKVADQAAKEFAIEQALAKMKGEWQDLELLVMDYGETGTYIIKARRQSAPGRALVVTCVVRYQRYTCPRKCRK